MKTAIAGVGRGPAASGAIPHTLTAVSEEISKATDEPVVMLRRVRLTDVQRDSIAATIMSLGQDVEEAGADEPRYGLLLALYTSVSTGVTRGTDARA